MTEHQDNEIQVVNLSDSSDKVRRYYDRNTVKFLRLARHDQPFSIHQPLYRSPGMSLSDALHTQHEEIKGLIPSSIQKVHVLDLGCGVGESMLWLAQNTPPNVIYHGTTLSGRQVEIAQQRISKYDDRIHVMQGDFHKPLPGLPPISVAYAIESFIHSNQPHDFFAQVSNILQPGGRLVIFDDMLSRIPESADLKIVDDLETGWLAHTLMTTDEVIRLAESHHLVLEKRIDMSNMLRLNRPRDRFISFIAPLARICMGFSQYCRFLVGGDARQKAYNKGLLQYCQLIFIRAQ